MLAPTNKRGGSEMTINLKLAVRAAEPYDFIKQVCTRVLP